MPEGEKWWVGAHSLWNLGSEPRNKPSDQDLKAASSNEVAQPAPPWLIAETARRRMRAPALGAFPRLEKLTSKENYKRHLESQNEVANKNPFPYSNAPKNPDVPEGISEQEIGVVTERYIVAIGALGEYQIKDSKLNLARFDFNKFSRENPRGNPNLGHKLHLNVPIVHAKWVSDYLINRGYMHKFLKGGEVDLGKIFTIYIGSGSLALKLAQEISRDLDGKLARPVDKTEVEYAPNVIGRFNVDGNKEFGRYPFRRLRGVSPLKIYSGMSLGWGPKIDPKEAFNTTFKRLSESYGEYFHG